MTAKPLTVKELIERLRTLDQEANVVLDGYDGFGACVDVSIDGKEVYLYREPRQESKTPTRRPTGYSGGVDNQLPDTEGGIFGV